FNPCSGHLVFIKSQARSFRALRVSVLLSTVTVSRIRPNWNKNVTSDPSMMLCKFFPVIYIHKLIDPNYSRKFIIYNIYLSYKRKITNKRIYIFNLKNRGKRRSERRDKELCTHRRIPDSGDRLLTYFLVRFVGSAPTRMCDAAILLHGVTVVRAVKFIPDTHSPMTFYSYLQVTDPP
ncbi:hypothetical protein ALC62_04692, partial [Cyphomyrmex costatus]